MAEFHYVYLIEHKILNKKYIGCRTSKIEPSKDILKYRTSSSDKDFKNEMKEFPENFNFEILEIFQTRQEAILYEIYLHNLNEVANNPDFYNRAKQTSTGFDSTGVKYDEKRKLSISENTKGEKNPFYGKDHSEENKKLFSKNNSEIICCPHCDISGYKSLLLQWHFENCLRHPIKFEENLKNRQLVRERKTGKNNPMYGITGVENKRSKIYKIFDQNDNLISTCIGAEIKNLISDLGLPCGFRYQFERYIHSVYSPKRFKKFEGWRIIHE